MQIFVLQCCDRVYALELNGKVCCVPPCGPVVHCPRLFLHLSAVKSASAPTEKPWIGGIMAGLAAMSLVGAAPALAEFKLPPIDSGGHLCS